MKKYIKNIAMFSASCLLLAGCAEALQEQHVPVQGALATKALNSPKGAEDDVLLLYMDKAEGLEDVFDQMGVVSYSRIFPAMGGDEAKLAKYGLDKWYAVELEKGVSLEKEAARLAEFAQVKNLQYNTIHSKGIQDDTYLVAKPAVATKAYESYSPEFNDPYFLNQWHYVNLGDKGLHTSAVAGNDINVKDAWKLTAGDPRVVVAVLDAGVKYSHPDLADNMWVNEQELNGKPGVDDDKNGFVDDIYGYNFVTKKADITWAVEGDTGHGTHVAGTIAAVNNNGIGVSGIAGGTGNKDGVRIMSCQIMSGDRGGTTLQIAQAARYAADNGASIIQGSFGFAGGTVTSDKQYETDYALEYQAFKYFIDTAHGCDALKGGLVIMAAGNDALPYSAYPAAHHEIVSVTATGIDGLPVPYSNYGPGSNISAPGGELTSYVVATGVLSTVPVEFGGDYGYKHGTSMACPHVSGVAALGLSYALKLGKTYTVNEFRSLLCTSTTDLNSRLEGSRTFEGTTLNLDSYRGKMGNGNVDAWKLLMAIDGTPCIQIPAEQEVLVDLAPVMGEQSEYMTYVSVTCSKDTEDSMGLMAKSEIVFGKLKLNCMFAGSGKFTIKAIAGGKSVGGGNVMGGTEVVREVSIISRYQSVSSNGGWL